MILGTAGHIDHGKTALVRALTGVDTDRLPEEKRRGITIDLGFAPLPLPNGVTLGVVDVPGHEAFVRTMLAGATGIDLALLVIAIDEGPMPQTREHLAILELLDVRRAVVALTKSDLVDDDWRALMLDDVKKFLAPTRFAAAQIIPTSTVTGEGIPELIDTLQSLADLPRTNRGGNNALPPQAETRVGPRAENPLTDLFRLPVDRAFSVKGTGTVVTGTVWSGSLSADETVRVMPYGTSARVRGLQSHGADVARLTPGMRGAIALAGIEIHAVARGATLVTRADWPSALILRADLTLLDGAPTLRPRTKVRFHLATSDVGARVVATGSPVAPGTSRTVRIVLDEPVMARAGDRFVLRSASPLATIGGGTVTDPSAPRRARPMAALALGVDERLALFVSEAGAHGLAEASLPMRLGVLPDAVPAILARATATRIGGRLYSSQILAEATTKLLEQVRVHHEQNPLSQGVPRQDMRARLGLDAAAFDAIVQSLVGKGKLAASAAELRLAGRTAELSEAQTKIADELYRAIAQAGHEPPSVAELAERFGAQTHAILKHLERQQRIVQVEDSRYYTPESVRDLLQRLEGRMAGNGELAPTELRETLGFSRKFLIPFLEYCDRRGYTARQGNGRVWRGR